MDQTEQAPSLLRKLARRMMGPQASPEAAPGMHYAPADVANALYLGILGRAPDQNGLRNVTGQLEAGTPVEAVAQALIGSSEFVSQITRQLFPPNQLPNLLELFPDRYEQQTSPAGEPMVLYKADSDADFDFLEHAILHHRYYDGFGVWGAKIDLDKQITAALVQGLGAKSCLELGCFTGAVLSVLEQAGVDVTGLDVSHVAFVLAYPNIKNRMLFGDLLTSGLQRRFDVVLAMDIIEHLNPVKFGQYIDAIAALVAQDGYFYINSPMIGADDVFGEVFERYVDEWQATGDATCWRRLDCDAAGWPKHGHLVWASPAWWERQFAVRGLVRDREVERGIHARLAPFFADNPARKCLFVLKHEGNTRNAAEVIESINAALDRVPDLNSQA
ncbi:MAG: methyltransferase domain-containing protein [Pseudomonadota bacterium]